MMKYRITFSKHNGDVGKQYTVLANSPDEAFKIAYNMPEALNRYVYANVGVQEVPEGRSTFGIMFNYYDFSFKKNFVDCVIIEANSEEEAVAYYKKNIQGKFFDGFSKTILPSGRCQYGTIKESYIAGCPGFNFRC